MPADRRTGSSVGSANGNSEGGRSTQRPYAKVNRSLRACDTCHARKTRCSGEQPCKFCVSRHIKCVISDDHARAQQPRAGTSRSQERGALQQSIEQRHSQGSPSPHVPPLSVPVNGTPITHCATSPQLPLPPPPPPTFGLTTRARSSPNPSTYYNNTAPAFSGVVPSRELSKSPDKAAAAASVLRELAPATRTSHSPPGVGYSSDGTIFSRFQKPHRYPNEADITLMLTREKSNRYLDLYFSEAECIYQLWPVPSIIQHCHDVIWGETPEAERYPVTTLPLGLRSTLTALLAFGALLDRDLNDSEMLYYAARSTYLDIVDAASLESIHLALQLAIFEMNSQRSSSVSSSLAVAIRTAQCLNLHRRSTMAHLPPEEALRRSQLWDTCFVQDCWLSVAIGRPPLVRGDDCDIEESIRGPDPQQAPAFVSPFLPLLIRLSSIWCDAHGKLFRNQDSGDADLRWNEALPSIDTELRVWQRDIHQLYARLSISLNRSERLHCQAVLLTFSSMRLTIHRAYLRKARIGGHERQHVDMLHYVASQNTVIDSAMDIAAYAKASLQLGMRLCFSFLGINLHIANLALWEHLQNKQKPGRMDDASRAEQGMSNIMWLVEHIVQSGDNPAMSEVLSAIRAMQRLPGRHMLQAEEPTLPTPPIQQAYADRNHASSHHSAGHYPEQHSHPEPRYIHSDRHAPLNPHASTSSQPHIPRAVNIRPYTHPSWAADIPPARSYEGTDRRRNQQPREVLERRQQE